MPDQLLTESDRAYARVSALQLMPESVTIQTYSSEQLSTGGWSQEWDDSYLNVRARISARSGLAGQERRIADQIQTEVDFLLTLPYDQPIATKNRILFEGQTLEVVFVDALRSLDTARRCFLRKVG